MWYRKALQVHLFVFRRLTERREIVFTDCLWVCPWIQLSVNSFVYQVFVQNWKWYVLVHYRSDYVPMYRL